jgi:flagella basal body P-ring formation protein FlgA
MILRDGAMTLSAQARANDSGSIGDSIRVTNTHSNQVVEATVDGPNRVKVPLNVGTLPAN